MIPSYVLQHFFCAAHLWVAVQLKMNCSAPFIFSLTCNNAVLLLDLLPVLMSLSSSCLSTVIDSPDEQNPAKRPRTLPPDPVFQGRKACTKEKVDHGVIAYVHENISNMYVGPAALCCYLCNDVSYSCTQF